MAALYTDEEGVLRSRTWWGEIETADPQVQPATPTLILPGFAGFVQFDSLDGLAAHLAGLLDGRRVVLVRSVASYEGFDTFPAFSVHARSAPGDNGGPPAAVYLATIAVQKATAEQVEQAIAAAAQARAA